MSDSSNSFGVADGVGGWKESNVNPAEYSRGLMSYAKLYMEGKLPRSEEFPEECQAAMEAGHKRVRLPGSATACIVHVSREGQLSFTLYFPYAIWMVS